MKRWLFSLAAVAAAATVRADEAAHVTVTIPIGATLTIDGSRTNQMTAVRRFVSPPIPTGVTYVYSFQATYTWKGSTVTRATTVHLKAGANATVDMAVAPEVPQPTTTPKPNEAPTPPNRFDVPKKPEPNGGIDQKADQPKKTDEPKKPVAPDTPKTATPAAPTKPPEAKSVAKEVARKPDIEVPYVPTPDKVVVEMLKLAAVKTGDVVYDLGCGDGRIVIAAVKDFKAKKGLGIDYNPERVNDSKKAAVKAGIEVAKKLDFKQGDVLKLTEKDFEGVDVVTLYLLPEVNLKLKPILQKGLKPGARIVSHDFEMGDDWKPEKSVTVEGDDGIEHYVHLWTIKEKK